MRPAPDLVPIEELDQGIVNLCTRINAATYELLLLVREFDERGGFLKWGLQNCAEWLAWRSPCGIRRHMWLNVVVNCAVAMWRRSMMRLGRMRIVQFGFVVIIAAA